jgi:hypothetical protein
MFAQRLYLVLWFIASTSIPRLLCSVFRFQVLGWHKNLVLPMRLHQGVLCCILSVRPLLFLNRKTDNSMSLPWAGSEPRLG